MSNANFKRDPQKKYRRLSHSLLFWFLTLSILPLTIIAWLSYQQAKESLIDVVSSGISTKIEANAKFIENWFFYRERDIENLAETTEVSQLLIDLSKAYYDSKLELSEFIQTYEAVEITEVGKADIETYSRRYDYVYDVLLMDQKGNVLYTLLQGNNLGSNILKENNKNSLFSKTVNKTVHTGKVLFSDIEIYKPTNNDIYGFITSPVINNKGMQVGVVAVQIRLERIIDLIELDRPEGDLLKSYIIGEDLKLRTSIDKKKNEVLVRKIQTDVSNAIRFSREINSLNNKPVFYKGPDGDRVIGSARVLNILGVNWAVINEVSKKDALASVNKLARLITIVLSVTVLFVILVAVYISRRITTPIEHLAVISDEVAAGNLDQKINIVAKNEISKLADAFKAMLESRLVYEHKINKISNDTQRALADLADQKFALDQHAMVSVTDVDGLIVFVNKRFCHLSGYSEDELIGKTHRVLSSGKHNNEFFAEMYARINQGNVWSGEICNVNKAGNEYWLDTTIVPFIDDKGLIKSYIAIRTDITVRKQNEIALERSEAAARAIFNSVAEGIITIDVNGNVLEFNPAAERIFGYAADEVVGQNVTRIMPEKYRGAHHAGMTKFLQTGEAKILDTTVEVEGLHKNNSVFPLELSITEIKIGDQQLFTALARDITERKKSQASLTEAKELAEEAVRVKSEFLASMSHEIRTPLNGVLGMLNLLRNTELDTVQEHRVDIAASSAHSLLQIINDILDFSKVDAGKVELELIDFNLRGMLGDFVEAMSHQAEVKGIELILDVTAIDESKVKGDPGRLRQILTNIVSNAIKFTSEGEILIRVELHELENKNYSMSCSVKDSGIGIPHEQQHKLFKSFSQVDASTTRKFGGTGLGLTIARKLCELMNGQINVESELGKGSTFTFDVELNKSNQSTMVVPDVDISSLKLLVLDDNKTNREVLGMQLKHWGAEVVDAENGKEALEICIQHCAKGEKCFDVAFIDMQMPMMDGAEVCRLIKAEPSLKTIKLVMMTSMSAQGDAQYFADLGFDAYFPKPTTTDDLFGALSVVAEGGQVLEQADPLVTRHYLKTLNSNRDDKSAVIESELVIQEGTRILLVEDNIVNQMVATTMLESLEGLAVTAAENGQIALDMLNAAEDKGELYSLVFMDCQMPVMDGFETSRQIRAGAAGDKNIKIPIVALTANAMKEDKARCLAAGMDDYISKPFENKDLEDKLKIWLKVDQAE